MKKYNFLKLAIVIVCLFVNIASVQANHIDDYEDEFGNDGIVAYSMATILIKDYFDNSGYADYLKIASINDPAVEVIVAMSREWAVHSWVKIKNPQGIKVKKYFVIMVEDIDGNKWKSNSLRFK